ncbi:Glutamate receptor 3.7 [Folsomia candida]|uniref:Glutamate receptor 3.7 n=1 Tax=Folsomia candida TaxID=158441 RepID=A0A226DD46_FOLCA|nr:Glutamate receptor 3.7 [Folsomia candida]
MRQINPDFAFTYLKFPILEEYYLNFAAESSSPAILVFLNLSNTKAIIIPCIGCVFPILIKISHSSSQSYLAAVWKALNTQNLNGGVMLTLSRFKNPSAICGFSLSRFHEHDSSVDCTLHLLSKRYNFTYVADIGVANSNINGVIGLMDLKIVLIEKSISEIESELLLIYVVEFAKINFAIVTQFPHAENSIWGFFTPFEGDIWASILASCMGISVIMQFQGKGLSNNFSGLRSVQDFIMVQSFLLGQAIADDIIKNVKSKQVFRPLLAIWFFVCYILMENLYQGSIYSDLTVIYPPHVPKTFEELVASNMTIITTSQVIRSFDTSKVPVTNSLLKTSIIPELLNKNFTPKFNKFVNQMNSKMEYINGELEDTSMVQNISSSLKIRSNKTLKWISTKGSFAIMDTLEDLELYVESLRILGKRLVFQGNEDSSFHFCLVAFGRRNFISPKIQAFLRTLAESCILGRFNYLENARNKMRSIKGLGTKIYSRFVAKLNSNYKEVKTFHEIGNENDDERAVGALWYVLALCSVVIAVAIVIFVSEFVLNRIYNS